MFNFEKLDVWKEAIALAESVYPATNEFPSVERLGMPTQMRRAALSISSNIAEGSSRHSKVDLARFVEIATGSLFELVSQSFLAHRQGLFSSETHQQLCVRSEKIGEMLSGLRSHLTVAAH